MANMSLNDATFTLGYKIAWLPRMLLAGLGPMGAFPSAPVKSGGGSARGAGAKRALFLGDLSAVANRRPPEFSDSLRALCRSADVIVANCESPIVRRSIMPLQTRLGFCHAMNAPFLVEILDAAAIAPERFVVSLANNHVADQGRAGLEETIAALKGLRIRPIGLRPAAPTPWETVEIGGMRIGFLAFTEWVDRDAKLFEEMIHCGAPDAAPAPGEVSLACALPHWGSEFRFRPDETARRLAVKLSACGADLIAGTHAHVIQPIEISGKTLVAYSLGDFLGSVLAHSPWPLKLSMALAVDFHPDMPHGSRIAGYEAHLFFRARSGGRERIDMLDELPGRERGRAQRLAERVLGGPPEIPVPAVEVARVS
jgi:hypothetical protein